MDRHVRPYDSAVAQSDDVVVTVIDHRNNNNDEVGAVSLRSARFHDLNRLIQSPPTLDNKVRQFYSTLSSSIFFSFFFFFFGINYAP